MKVDTLAKELLFCTVRITNNLTNGKQSVGTGFYFNAASDPNKKIPLIVTNKHVVEGARELILDMLVQNTAGDGPQLGKRIQRTLGPGFVGHPDPAVDVAVLPLAPHWDQWFQEKPPPFLRTIGWDAIPTNDAMGQFDAIEDLTFIGYPNGIADPKNHTPIVRRAITATWLGAPFGGAPTFMLDGSVFGGSSGSPVFIFNNTGWADSQGNINMGTRIFLVGIIAASAQDRQELPVQGLPAAPAPLITLGMPSPPAPSAPPFVRVAHALNLGYAFSTIAIGETINHLLSANGLPTGTGLKPYT